MTPKTLPPRRYPTHREALKGSFLWPSRLRRGWILALAGGIFGQFLASVLMYLLRGEPLSWTTDLYIPLAVILAAWPTGAAVLYIVTALAGGIMSREERERKQNSLPR